MPRRGRGGIRRADSIPEPEGRRLEAWQKQSLPADRDVAQTLYREWLRAKCSDAGVTLDDIQTDQRTTRTEAYTTIGYTITAHGSLKAVTSLLYNFYRSTVLQQITRLVTVPGPYTNVNVAHFAYGGMNGWFAHYWTYWLANTAAVAVVLWMMDWGLAKLFPPRER